jgi:EspA/EspE family
MRTPTLRETGANRVRQRVLAWMQRPIGARKLRHAVIFNFSDAARIITSLGNVGAQFAGFGVDTGGSLSGEALAATVTGSTGSFGSMLSSRNILDVARPVLDWPANKFRRNSKWQNFFYAPVERVQFARLGIPVGDLTVNSDGAKGVDVNMIPLAIDVVGYLEMLLGFGPPNDGGDLESGSQQFVRLSEELKAALPDDRWRGAGSQAYAQLDAELRSIAQRMAELDTEFAEVVKNQGEWVTHMRLGFGILTNILTAAIWVEVAMRLAPPPAGEFPAKVFAVTVSLLAIKIAIGMLGVVIVFSIENSNRAEALIPAYEGAAAGTVQAGRLVQSEVAERAQSTVSSFEAIANSMSGTLAGAYASGAASSAAAARASADERATRGAAAGGPPGPAVPAAPASAGLTMPSLAQLSALSGQAGKASGQLSAHANVVNQATGQVQQVAQMGQRRREAPAPADGATLEGDVEATGAGVGTEAAGRAPVEVEADEPPAGERTL